MLTSMPRWSLATRVAFRFSVAYFGLYVVVAGMLSNLIGLPYAEGLSLNHLTDGAVTWVGKHLLHVATFAVETGSGDRMFDWVQAVCVLTLAVAVTVVWSIVDRERADYRRLYRGFRVLLRFALGATLLGYGLAKITPLQMQTPSLVRLLEPFGNFSPMGVLWSSIGAAAPYERFTGAAEVVGSMLLFVPATATLGAIVCFVDLVEVFTLNMTYDVPVKLFSFHLLLMAVVVLAPDVSRIVRLVVARGPWRWPAVVQSLLGVYLVGMGVHGTHSLAQEARSNLPHPALYGIWIVEEMEIDGATRPPLQTDPFRWRRLIVEEPTQVTLWRMDDSRVTCESRTDGTASVLWLSGPGECAGGKLTVERPMPDELITDGDLGRRHVHATLAWFDPRRLQLLSTHFHWVQEFPVNLPNGD